MCERSLNRGSLASEARQRLPTEAERARLRRWVRRRLSDTWIIGMVAMGEMDLTGTWHGSTPWAMRFDWEHAPPDWMNPTPQLDGA